MELHAFPTSKSVPDFNLEQELAAATAFVMEAAIPAGMKNPPKPKPASLGRSEMSALALDSHAAAVAAHDEHDDE